MSTEFNDPIPEGVSVVYKARLLGYEGEPLIVPTVQDIRVTLTDRQSETKIRDNVSLLNENGGSLDEEGWFRWILSGSDTAAITSRRMQLRRAIFTVNFANGVGRHDISFFVENFAEI